MKKIFKLTLFKKIFFIILIGFLVVLGINVYLDYQSQIYSNVHGIAGERNIEILNSLSQTLLNSSEDIQDKEVIDMYQKAAKDNYGYHVIYNENNDVIYENFSEYYLSEEPYLLVIEKNNSEGSSSKKIDMSKLKQPQIDQIESIIMTAYHRDAGIYIDIEGNVEKIDPTDNSLTSYVIYPQYLRINNILVLGNQQSIRNEEYIVEAYSSKNIRYDSYSSEGTARLKDYNQIKKQCKNVINDYIEYGAIGETNINYQIINKDLYTVTSHYVNKGVKYGYKLIQVHYLLNMTDDILESAINSKQLPYKIALIVVVCMSLLISYMITRPIKKVQKAALKIANQEFDEPLKIKSKDEIGSLANSINTMREQLKETIRQLHEEINHVKELENLRKDFINQFTHEMKTPLGIINGYSELIEEAENDEEVEKYLDIMNRETSRINQLIQAMLSLSRLEAGKVELNLESFDLEDLITEIIDEYEVLFMQKNIKIEVITINKELYADKKLISTVIHNFMSNAIKHTFENGQIIITLNQGLTVYNEGNQIPEEQLQNIWYTFVTHDREGSGLGLAICQAILELHHFDYGVQNKESGVEFYFYQNNKK